MKKTAKHVRSHAKKHLEAHLKLKDLLSKYSPKKEKVLGIFLATFFIVLFTLLIFRNWGNIIDLFKPEPKPPAQAFETNGFKTGVLSVYKIEGQATQAYRDLLTSIPTTGSDVGAEVSLAFGEERGEELPSREETLKNTVWLTNYLSKGQHLTKLEQERAKALQKSIISTYYLGETTIDIDSTLQIDSKILSQISNTLSVDLFQYLNQAVSRADALNEYLNLLNVLLDKTNQRIMDLQYKIDFLVANFRAKEEEIKISEEIFFENLKIFSGPDAEEELGHFIGLQEAQVEIRAKLGAYESLKGYYEFFKPRLENLITAIKANRDPLIAGVKVVEIQSMTLPLIIKGQN